MTAYKIIKTKSKSKRLSQSWRKHLRRVKQAARKTVTAPS
jgi:hypothetical protein